MPSRINPLFARGASSYRNRGSADYLTTTTNVPSRTSGAMCGWFVRRSNTGGYQCLLTLERSAAWELWTLAFDTSTTPALGIGNGQAFTQFTGPVIRLNEPFFGYIEGNASNIIARWRGWRSSTWHTVSLAYGNTDAPQRVTIGNQVHDTTLWADANFWNVRVWNAPLTLEELNREYASHVPVRTQGLLHWYPLEGDARALVLDRSGGNNRLTQVGSGRPERFFLPRWWAEDVPRPVVVATAGTTPVGRDFSKTYSITAPVGRDFAKTYQVTAAVGRDFAKTYVVTAAVGREFAHTYNIIAPVGRDFAKTYQVIAPVGQNFSYSYQVTAPVGRDFSKTYTVTSAVGREFTHSYTIVAPVGQNFVHTYSIVASVWREFAHSYTVASVVGRSLDYSYVVTTAVGRDFNLTYGIFSTIGADFTFLFSIGDEQQTRGGRRRRRREDETEEFVRKWWEYAERSKVPAEPAPEPSRVDRLDSVAKRADRPVIELPPLTQADFNRMLSEAMKSLKASAPAPTVEVADTLAEDLLMVIAIDEATNF